MLTPLCHPHCHWQTRPARHPDSNHAGYSSPAIHGTQQTSPLLPPRAGNKGEEKVVRKLGGPLAQTVHAAAEVEVVT